MNEEYAAGLIDRQAMLAGKFQLAQISNANLSLAERQVDFDHAGCLGDVPCGRGDEIGPRGPGADATPVCAAPRLLSRSNRRKARLTRASRIVHRGSSASTSYVLAALRALHVDPSHAVKNNGSYDGRQQPTPL